MNYTKPFPFLQVVIMPPALPVLSSGQFLGLSTQEKQAYMMSQAHVQFLVGMQSGL